METEWSKFMTPMPGIDLIAEFILFMISRMDWSTSPNL